MESLFTYFTAWRSSGAKLRLINKGFTDRCWFVIVGQAVNRVAHNPSLV